MYVVAIWMNKYVYILCKIVHQTISDDGLEVEVGEGPTIMIGTSFGCDEWAKLFQSVRMRSRGDLGGCIDIGECSDKGDCIDIGECIDMGECIDIGDCIDIIRPDVKWVFIVDISLRAGNSLGRVNANKMTLKKPDNEKRMPWRRRLSVFLFLHHALTLTGKSRGGKRNICPRKCHKANYSDGRDSDDIYSRIAWTENKHGKLIWWVNNLTTASAWRWFWISRLRSGCLRLWR